MKKLIIIAILSFSVNAVFAQNQHTTTPDAKQRQERAQFIDAELAKIAKQQAANAQSNKTETAAPVKKGASDNVQTQRAKSDLELRIENATKSGTPAKR